ncbi:MAG: hypothetical protein HOO06_14065 [Bdellovibrionaceae bacterium]|nr:hypothetical protein [Pseudobdellovibrionaceae bacterium]
MAFRLNLSTVRELILVLFDSIPGFVNHKSKTIVIKNAEHFPWLENLIDIIDAIENFQKGLISFYVKITKSLL